MHTHAQGAVYFSLAVLLDTGLLAWVEASTGQLIHTQCDRAKRLAAAWRSGGSAHAHHGPGGRRRAAAVARGGDEEEGACEEEGEVTRADGVSRPLLGPSTRGHTAAANERGEGGGGGATTVAAMDGQGVDDEDEDVAAERRAVQAGRRVHTSHVSV